MKLYYTPAQKRIIHLQEMYPGRGLCNIGGIIKLEAAYEEKLLRKAFGFMLTDIPILRLRVNEKNEAYIAPVQAELEKWPGMEKPEMAELSEWVAKPMEAGLPLCRAMYSQNELYIKVHHLLVDSYGVVLCVQKLTQIIDCLAQKKEWHCSPDWRFVDQMKEERKSCQKGIDWLCSCMSDNGQYSGERAVRRYGVMESVRSRFRLSDTMFRKIRQMEEAHHTSFEIIFTAALAVYCSRVRETDKIAFGRSLLNRKRDEMDLPGMMTNTLPVFLTVDQNQEFWDFCRQIKNYFYKMIRYSDLDMEEFLKETGMKRIPYDIMVTFRNSRYIPFVKGIEQQEIYNLQLELPLRIYIDDLGEEIRIDFLYQTECCTQQEIDALYLRLLSVMEQGFTGAKISEISIMSSRDRELWDVINRTDCELPKKLAVEKIFEHLEQDGPKCAAYYENGKLSYRQIRDRAESLGGYLLEKGIAPGAVVGVCLEDPADILCAFLGIWKAGAAFLPVSIRENGGRIEYIRKLCGFFIDGQTVKAALSYRGTAVFPRIRPEDSAYYMFTSGSTGEAKAAMISHRSLTCRLEWMEQKYHCAESVFQKASCTFDVSMWEYFLPLMEGGCVYLTSEEEKRNPEILLKRMYEWKIGTVHFVPSLLSVWLDYVYEYKAELPCLRHVFSSGEVLSPSLVRRFYEYFPQVQLHNLYGPTECTIDVTYYDCKKNDERIPIGRPVSWTKVKILDSRGRCVPPGIEGELSVSGLLVGAGYWKQDSDRFYENEDGDRTFDTGDRAVLDFDGQICYRGRKDGQCKINGMRIDLEQIENVIREVPGVLRSAALIRNNQITAFYMASEPVSGIEAYLTKRLPYYSIPHQIVFCREIPLNKNGKADRQALKAYLTDERQVLPRNKREQKILKAAAKKLGRDISVEENLFLAGMDSLMVMSLVLELEKIGLKYTPEDFYQNPTVRRLASCDAAGCFWLNRQGSRRLVLAFPYAAGTPGVYRVLSERLKKSGIDFCVARYAEKIPDLYAYEQIVLLGYCTGTAEAVKTAASSSEDEKNKIKGILLCAAVPPSERMRRDGSVWRKFSDRALSRFLDYLHGMPVNADQKLVSRFRSDTDRFFRLFQEGLTPVPMNAVLLLGDRDILTFPSAYCWRRWKKYLSGNIKVYGLKKKGHFFIENSSALHAKVIMEMFRSGKRN